MNRLAQPDVTAQDRRRSRVNAILNEEPFGLPNYINELDVLLRGPAVDLKKVTRVIRSNPGLSARIHSLANSPLFSLTRRELSIPETIVLLGSVRSRTLLLCCGLMEITDRHLSAENAQAFWQHSFLSALFSERIARWMDHPETEQAYLGGLVHDIGQLPLLIVAAEEPTSARDDQPDPWEETMEIERDYFAIDHCETGRWMGISWDFPPSLIDVCQHHHAPSAAQQDPSLVGIVAAGDHFSRMKGSLTEIAGSQAAQGFLEECLPHLNLAERRGLVQLLDAENLHAIRFPELYAFEEQLH